MALLLWQYSLKSADYVFGNKIDSGVQNKILIELQMKSTGLTKTQVFQIFNNHTRHGHRGGWASRAFVVGHGRYKQVNEGARGRLGGKRDAQFSFVATWHVMARTRLSERSSASTRVGGGPAYHRFRATLTTSQTIAEVRRQGENQNSNGTISGPYGP